MIDADIMLKAIIVSLICIAIVVSNILTIFMLISIIKDPDEVQGIDYYLLSLTISDTMHGTIVAPFSVHSIILGKWAYGSFFCQIAGYLTVTLWCVNVITFLWISVDRYLFIHLAHKYTSGHWKSKCKCWIGVTWLTASLFCLAPIMSARTPTFVAGASVCMMNWHHIPGYFITILILAIGPSLATTIHNYTYLFYMKISIMIEKNRVYKKHSMITVLNVKDSSHCVAFTLLFIFWLSWFPYILLLIIEYSTSKTVDNTNFKFACMWIGFSQSVWKIIILTSLSYKYKTALKSLFKKTESMQCGDSHLCYTTQQNQIFGRHIDNTYLQSYDIN